MNRIIILSAICLMFLGSPAFGYKTGQAKLGLGKKVDLIITENEAERSLGLGQRDKLAANTGMLFLFDNADEQIFWMKDMRFSIDIIWLLNSEIVHIEKNVPAPSLLQYKLPTYGQGITADSVLELNAGEADQFMLKPGMRIDISK